MTTITVRKIKNTEIPLLADFLYHAIFLPPGTAPLPKEIINEPSLYIYIKDFGQPGDHALVAEQDSMVLGAAWTRIVPAYGHLDDETPELALSVLPGHRGHGIGTLLLNNLLALLHEHGYGRTSLSVQKANPAVHLYQRAGYHILRENSEDYLMVKNL